MAGETLDLTLGGGGTAVPAGTEHGGIAWDPAISHIAGDVVTLGTEMFIAKITNAGITPVSGVETVQWLPTAIAEKGGVAWNAGVNYDIGDIVFDEITQQVYWCNTSNTSGAIGGDFASDATFWTLVPQSLLVGWFDPTVDGGFSAPAIPLVINGGAYTEGQYIIAQFAGFYDFVLGTAMLDATTTGIEVKRGDRFRCDALGNFELFVDGSQSVVGESTAAGFPVIGESDTLYIDESTDFIYRWDPLALPAPGQYVGVTKPGAVGNITTAPFRFTQTTVGDPTAGFVSINNAIPSNATEISISNFDRDGVSRTYGLDLLTGGDFIGFIDDNSDKIHHFRISGLGVDNITYWTYPVAIHELEGGTFAQGERLHVDVLFVSPNIINDLEDVDTVTLPALNEQGLIYDAFTNPLAPLWTAQDIDNTFEYKTIVGHSIPVLTALDNDWLSAQTTSGKFARGVVAVSHPDVVRIVTWGKLEAVGHGLINGEWQYLDEAIPGGYTNIKPVAQENSQKLFYAIDANHIFVDIDNYMGSAACPCGYVAETGTATYVADLGTNNFFDYTMTMDSSLTTPLNIEPGQNGTIVVRQDSIGAWLATWAPEYVFPEGLPILNASDHWVHVFEYRCISTTEVVMEYVLDYGRVPPAPPIFAVADFNATDIEVAQITFTWTDATGSPIPVHDLYNSTGLVQANVSSPYVLAITGTENYFIRATNSGGTADSVINEGTGTAGTPPAVVSDFLSSEGEVGQITFTWTNPAGSPTITYQIWTFGGLLIADNVSNPAVVGITTTDNYYVKSTNGAGSSDSNIDYGYGIDGLPIANAGPDQAERTGTSIVLDGSGSIDTGGSIVSWVWSLGGVDIGTGEFLSKSDFPDGTNVVTLTVTDNAGNTDTDTVEIFIDPSLPFAPTDFNVTDDQVGQTTSTWSTHPDTVSYTLWIGSLEIAFVTSPYIKSVGPGVESYKLESINAAGSTYVQTDGTSA